MSSPLSAPTVPGCFQSGQPPSTVGHPVHRSRQPVTPGYPPPNNDGCPWEHNPASQVGRDGLLRRARRASGSLLLRWGLWKRFLCKSLAPRLFFSLPTALVSAAPKPWRLGRGRVGVVSVRPKSFWPSTSLRELWMARFATGRHLPRNGQSYLLPDRQRLRKQGQHLLAQQ